MVRFQCPRVFKAKLYTVCVSFMGFTGWSNGSVVQGTPVEENTGPDCSITFGPETEALVQATAVDPVGTEQNVKSSGAESNRDQLPTYARLQKAYSQGVQPSIGQIFAWSVVERNAQEGCDCNPGGLRKVAMKSVAGLNEGLHRLFGVSSHLRAALTDGLSRDLSRARGNLSTIQDIIGREKRRFLDALESSLNAESDYLRLYLQVHNLLHSGSQTKELPLFKLIEELDEASRRLSEISRILTRVESGEKLEQVTAKSPDDSASYLELFTEARELKKAISHIRSKITRYQAGAQANGDRVGSFYSLNNLLFGHRVSTEEMILIQSRTRLYQAVVDSQMRMADLIIAMERWRVVINTLNGDLSGLPPTFDRSTLMRFATMLTGYAPMFSELPTIKDPVQVIASMIDREEVPSRIHEQIWTFANSWLQIWVDRVESLKPRIDFNMAMANTVQTFTRLVAANTIESTARNFGVVTGSVANLASKSAAGVWQAILDYKVASAISNASSEILRSQGSEAQAADRAQRRTGLNVGAAEDQDESTVDGEDVRQKKSGADTSKNPKVSNSTEGQQFRTLLDAVRGVAADKNGSNELSGMPRETYLVLKSTFSQLAIALEGRKDLTQDIPQDFYDHLRSAEAVEILVFSLDRLTGIHVVGSTEKQVFHSNLVVEAILQAQIRKLQRNTTHSEFIQNIGVWTTAVLASRYVGQPMLSWFMRLF